MKANTVVLDLKRVLELIEIEKNIIKKGNMSLVYQKLGVVLSPRLMMMKYIVYLK